MRRSFADVERALLGRPGWRREGRALRGPCPILGVGRDRCWFQPGAAGGIAAGCRGCGDGRGRLDAAAFAQHLDAVTAGTGVTTSSPAAPAAPPGAAGSRPALAWRAGGPVREGSAGWRYLVERRRVWPAGLALPGSVRWLPAAAAAEHRVRPRPPAAAAGLLLYRFTHAAEKGPAAALQVEAVTADGARVVGGWRLRDRGRDVERALRRPTIAGSAMAGRVLEVLTGAIGRGVHVAEGPLDGLALVALERLGVVSLAAAAVVAVPGTATMAAAAVVGQVGPVTIWADGDGPGVVAAARMRAALGSRARVRFSGGDVAEWASIASVEREAMGDA